MAVLTIIATEDYSDGVPALDPNITDIVFDTTGPGSVLATFGSNQFGAGVIANNVAITGDDDTSDTIRVNLSAAGGFSAAGWTLNNWAAADRVNLAGTSGDDTLTGTASNDTLQGFEGTDILDGGAGNDVLRMNAGDAAAGEVIDGGAGTADQMQLFGGTHNFLLTSIAGIEILFTEALAATFGDSQLRAGAIAIVLGNPSVTQSVAVNGSDINLSGVAFSNWGASGQSINLNGTSGDDTITGSGRDDIITGGAGGDVIDGGLGNDTLVVNVDPATGNVSVSFTGGGGIDAFSLVGAQSFDFSSSAINGVEEIRFAPTGPQTATFTGSQVGAGGITSVVGDAASFNRYVVNGTSIDLSGVSLSNWSSLDEIDLNGTSGNDTITGSDQNDRIVGRPGIDILSGGLGNDAFPVEPGDLGAGEAVNGGDGDDAIELTSAGSFDFSVVTINGVETLRFGPVGPQTATFTGSQVGAGGITSVVGDAASFNRYIVNGTSIDLSGVSFSNWSSLDEINLNGTFADDTITGSDQNDRIVGRPGIDILSGGLGDDAFPVEPGDLGVGEAVNGGDGADAIELASAGSFDFTSWTIGGTEEIRFGPVGVQVAILTGSQVGAGAIASVVGDDASSNNVVVNGADIDVSAVDYLNWRNNDSITLFGTAGNDTIVGSDQADTINGGANNDTIIGGADNDSAVFSGSRFAYSLTNLGGGDVRVVGLDGDDMVRVERYVWADATLNWPPANSGDFNADAFGDVLFRNTTTGQNATWELNGAGGFGFDSYGAANLDWRSVGPGDFNRDGKGDILFRNMTTGQVATWELNGSGGFSFDSYGAANLDWRSVGPGDFNRDGKSDVLFRNTSTGQVATWELNGSGGFAFDSYGMEALAWKIAGIGDFNNDGMDDILWRNSTTGGVKTWELDGAGGFVEDIYGAANLTWHIYGVGDFNADGRDDILFRNDNGKVATWELNGMGGFSVDFYGGAGSQWTIMHATDTNSDGKDDILWRNTTNGQVAAWELNGSGGIGFQGYGAANLTWDIVDGNFEFV